MVQAILQTHLIKLIFAIIKMYSFRKFNEPLKVTVIRCIMYMIVSDDERTDTAIDDSSTDTDSEID